MKKLIVKYKIFKRKIVRNFMQHAADVIISQMEKTNDVSKINYLYSLGMELDMWANFYNIKLK